VSGVLIWVTDAWVRGLEMLGGGAEIPERGVAERELVLRGGPIPPLPLWLRQ